MLQASYGSFAADAGSALDHAASADGAFNGQFGSAATSDASGHRTSGAVLTAASGDASTLAAVSGTPGGQRALIATLRGRVAEQLRAVNVYRARDARLAAMLRRLEDSRGGAGGGNPVGAVNLLRRAAHPPKIPIRTVAKVKSALYAPVTVSGSFLKGFSESLEKIFRKF